MTGVGRTSERLRDVLPRDTPDPPPEEGTPAAVMVPVLDFGDPALLFTVRSDLVGDHRGEISFPGGVRHPGDADLLATALRETEEELGIPREAFEVVGALPPTPTVVSGYVIQPFVGILDQRPSLSPSPDEIAEVLELDIARLARVEEEVHRETGPGVRRSWFAYALDGYTVWGATGRIVHSFLDVWTKEA
jgi:8-oxo-dGTP pyrophosphatase MutT (NUDIX family)